MTVSNNDKLELTYTGIYVHKKNHIVITTIVDEYAKDNRDHALIYHLIDGEWFQQLISDNSICAICSIYEPNEKIFAIGVDGRVDIAELPGFSQERVDQSDRGPNSSVTLRCSRSISNKIYVAGMARQVYCRTKETWQQWDEGVFVPRGYRTKAVGFLDIDGLS